MNTAIHKDLNRLSSQFADLVNQRERLKIELRAAASLSDKIEIKRKIEDLKKPIFDTQIAIIPLQARIDWDLS